MARSSIWTMPFTPLCSLLSVNRLDFESEMKRPAQVAR